jgi:HEAT repeat protein
MHDAAELLSQVATMSRIVRRRIAKALAAESLEEARETMVEALEGLDTIIELTASASPGEAGGDA